MMVNAMMCVLSPCSSTVNFMLLLPITAAPLPPRLELGQSDVRRQAVFQMCQIQLHILAVLKLLNWES